MKVVHFATSDIQGGAARAAYRLHQGLCQAGVDSSMFVLRRSSEDATVVELREGNLLQSPLKRVKKTLIYRELKRYPNRPADGNYFSTDRSIYGRDILEQLPECDILNLHWTTWFLDYQDVFSGLPANQKLVWTLHDMNPFTGGCHYSSGCDKFSQQCGACPQLGSDKENDFSRESWTRKNQAFTHLRSEQLRVVAPSRWLTEEAGRSSLLGRFPKATIPYGVDTDAFAPRDRRSARDVLGVPQDAQVMLFVADALDETRKGLAYLTEALQNLKLPKGFLISVGKNSPVLNIEMPHLHLGHIASERLLSMIYSAADVFIIPSLEDNLPNTVLESLACGTPVVGFASGGITDMVRPNVTGWLVSPKDVSELHSTLTYIFGDLDSQDKLRVKCRSIALSEYSLNLQAQRYAQLYTTLL